MSINTTAAATGATMIKIDERVLRLILSWQNLDNPKLQIEGHLDNLWTEMRITGQLEDDWDCDMKMWVSTYYTDEPFVMIDTNELTHLLKWWAEFGGHMPFSDRIIEGR